MTDEATTDDAGQVEKKTWNLVFPGAPVERPDENTMVIGCDKWLTIKLNRMADIEADNPHTLLHQMYVEMAILQVGIETRKLAALEAQTQIQRETLEFMKVARSEERQRQAAEQGRMDEFLKNASLYGKS